MSYLLSIGQRIKFFRKRAGMSQDALAKKCNYISRSSINKIELGHTDIPLLKLLTIADALSVSPIEIMFPVDPETYTEYETVLLKCYEGNADVSLFIDGMLEATKGEGFSAAYVDALQQRGLDIPASAKTLESCAETDETLVSD